MYIKNETERLKGRTSNESERQKVEDIRGKKKRQLSQRESGIERTSESETSIAKERQWWSRLMEGKRERFK